MDSAPIHRAAGIAEELIELLENANVRLVFLPLYSPECNPCELVFAQVKRFLRSYRGTEKFFQEIARAFSRVTFANVLSYYRHCIERF